MARKEERRELMPFRAERIPSVFEDMDRLFERFFERPLARSWWPMFRWPEEVMYPSVDIFEEKDEVVVKAEVPGAKKDELSVEITDNSLIIAGEKKKEEKIEEKDYYRHERSSGSFSRVLHLPTEVTGSAAKARFSDGVLEIRIPKSEEAKKKEVKVKIE